ncbi:hypothetical protein SXHG_00024 [Synechococcus phage MRHenn-2013a]|nr:hypothetical protein SXHG_00024 [Synechococcus phage MRHenn-2013a]
MSETTEKKTLRVDENKVVVVRHVPMTSDTCDKLRAIKAKFEKENGVDITYPVTLQMMTDALFENYFGTGDK